MGREFKINVERYRSGRIKPPSTDAERAPPGPRVQSNRSLFDAKCFQGGGHGKSQAGDMIGKLWLCGLLEGEAMRDGTAIEGKELLRVGREWFDGRTAYYADVAARTAKGEASSHASGMRRVTGSVRKTRAEARFLAYDASLDRARFEDRAALLSLMNEVEVWPARIVATWVTTRLMFLPIYGAGPAREGDYDSLRAARRALAAMYAGQPQRRAA